MWDDALADRLVRQTEQRVRETILLDDRFN